MRETTHSLYAVEIVPAVQVATLPVKPIDGIAGRKYVWYADFTADFDPVATGLIVVPKEGLRR